MKGGKSTGKEEEMFDDDNDIGDTKAKTQQQRLDDDFDTKPTVEKSNPNKRKRVDKEDEMEILNQIGVIDEDNNPPREREKKSFTMPGQIRDPPVDDDFDIKPTVEKSNPNKRKRVDKEDEMEILNQIGVIDEDNNPPRKREKKSFTMPG